MATSSKTHRQHLKLKSLQPKTIQAYARALNRLWEYFDHQIHDLAATPDRLGQGAVNQVRDQGQRHRSPSLSRSH